MIVKLLLYVQKQVMDAFPISKMGFFAGDVFDSRKGRALNILIFFPMPTTGMV